MKHGTFYLIPQEFKQQTEFSYIEKFICTLISIQWRSGKNILVACENEHQAIKIDEILWTFDQNTFLPHNLFGKTIHTAPVVIYWRQCCYNNNPKDLLINLMKQNMDFFFNFNEIIDFVPVTDILKKCARHRYQSYKKNGFKLNVINIPIS
ncbi:DNA polymerase III subunit chi [Blochmannia endosymbiont of Camponotus sp.]|uniref:DNA polymerase III subunit chi n=1 Tax=Blochmannia endosymbiont of Camponotus sp. TaxID=700220 RepID=UPI0020250D95|nr:DNA polymerase III subunit chi [Blochmannia endosymbiont of Camponotus sp.]URJ29758.1 DNA polymerase III subunit chi [Blochmannia endosymbiont of Camponotus sp.]URJ31342.1 DNA polymerase III subunit chi [Blochmannia endosymbiont of Camponotus sp.]